MKKLMITLAAVAFATALQAATFQWKTGAISIKDGTGGGTATSVTKIYLFNEKDFSQQQFITAMNDSTKGFSYITAVPTEIGETPIFADVQTLSAGKLNVYSPTDASGTDIGTTYEKVAGSEMYYAKAYFAVIDTEGKRAFLSESLEQIIAAGDDPTQFQFTGFGDATKLDKGTASTWGTAGWYNVQAGAAPEPTSGLLLLLGVAGLALRRRRV